MENHASSVHSGASSPRKTGNKSNMLLALGAVAVILIVLAVANFGGNLFGGKKLSADEARTVALNFINTNLVEGTEAEVTEVTDYSDSLYKLNVKVGDNNIESYITKDGKQFFPQAMATDGTATVASNTNTPAATPVVPADIPKSDKPEVELFVMSHCPYGTQMEKGMVPVMETLKDKANIKIKFVNYIMHAAVEKDDNLVQYCIDKEDNSKYTGFLKCFLASGNSASCMSSTGVNESKVKNCIAATDKQFKITEAFNDRTLWATGSFPPFNIHDAENKKYAVQGSPTLVINGKTVETNRDSASLLATVCGAFNNAPEECNTKLDATTPGAGFGTTAAAVGGSAAAACAPS